MLKSFSRHIDNLLLGEGLEGFISIILDRIKFYAFFQFYYPYKFKHYGKNIRWGRDFRRLVIPTSVRVSCAEKISIFDECCFGDFVYLQCDSHSLDNGITIGRRSRINSHGHILAGSEIIIGDEVLIAPFTLITSNNHRYDLDESIMNQGMKPSGKIEIGKGSWIGQNAKILGGAKLGEKVVVAAGAIIRRGDYQSNSKILGTSQIK